MLTLLTLLTLLTPLSTADVDVRAPLLGGATALAPRGGVKVASVVVEGGFCVKVSDTEGYDAEALLGSGVMLPAEGGGFEGERLFGDSPCLPV